MAITVTVSVAAIIISLASLVLAVAAMRRHERNIADEQQRRRGVA